MRPRSILLPPLAALAIAEMDLPPSFAQDRQALERRGEALLSKHCAMCHAVGRSGESPNPIAPAFRTLGTRYPVEQLEEALAEGIFSGHPEMPEFVFAPHEVGAIVAYLRSIQGR